MQGIWQLRQRHHIMMVAYAMAAGPDWDQAPLTLCLDYHEWFMQKVNEGDPRQRPSLKQLIDADFGMRNAWMLSYINQEKATWAEAALHHRTHSAFLFTGLTSQGRQPPAQQAQNDPGPRNPQRRQSKPAAQSKAKAKGRGKGAGAIPTKGFLTKAYGGRDICVYWNKGHCTKHNCPFAHVQLPRVH